MILGSLNLLKTSQDRTGVHVGFSKVLKSLFFYLVKVLYKYQKNICYGCQVDHPSQSIMSFCSRSLIIFSTDTLTGSCKCCGHQFIPSILSLNGIRSDEGSVWGVADAILYELKPSWSATDKVKDMYDTMVGCDFVKIAQLCVVSDYWKGLNE